jgi:hypothetical protein
MHRIDRDLKSCWFPAYESCVSHCQLSSSGLILFTIGSEDPSPSSPPILKVGDGSLSDVDNEDGSLSDADNEGWIPF